MIFAGVSYLAILVAAVASWIFGALWYMALAKPWMAAHGWATKEEMLGPASKPSAVPFVLALLAELLMAWVLAGIIGHTGKVTVGNGLISAFLAWIGFVITTMAVNHAYSQAKPALTMIEGGHWLGVLLVQGLVIGLFGVR
jgi:Protein of unknown function (DUF1761)